MAGDTGGRMVIERYGEADRPEMMTLHRETMVAAGAYRGPGPWEADLEDIQEAYFDRGGEFLVGRFAGRLVAMGAYLGRDPENAEIKRMRVNPSLQGRGLADRILEALEASARERGFRRLYLETSEIQVRAIHFYRKNGFRPFRREVIDGFNCLWFEKFL